jgi:quinol monooxygenase YgiN
MYGTVARMRVKPGKVEDLMNEMKSFESLPVDGYMGTSVYRMDDNANEVYIAVAFNDKGSYMKNADSPEQNERFQKMMSFLEAEPEWHDGEIISSHDLRLAR